MALTHVIMVPKSTVSSPFYQLEGLGSQFYHFGANAYGRVNYLDEMMVLDWGTWMQFNKLKAAYLFRSSNSISVPSGDVDQYTPTEEPLQETHHFVDDCCVICDSHGQQSIEVVYSPLQDLPTDETESEMDALFSGCVECSSPSFSAVSDMSGMPAEQHHETPWTREIESVLRLINNDAHGQNIQSYGPTILDTEVSAEAYGALGYFNDPCAFMMFDNRRDDKKPVIFDTGASLAITPDKDNLSVH